MTRYIKRFRKSLQGKTFLRCNRSDSKVVFYKDELVSEIKLVKESVLDVKNENVTLKGEKN